MTDLNQASSGITAALIARDNLLSSLGETLGEFKAYSNDLPIADITGTRIVKCLYQLNKATGTKAGDNSFVRIPTKHLTEAIIVERVTELSPYILAYLQAEEDKQIKADHKKGSLSVYTEYLSVDKLIAGLEASEAGARLTKEKVEAWFIESMEDNLKLLICDKMNIVDSITSEQEQKIQLMVNAYKLKFVSLANPKTVLVVADRDAMINVITKCEAQDSLLGARFIAKITGMKEAIQEQLLEL
jgi:predicted transcriptional regulator